MAKWFGEEGYRYHAPWDKEFWEGDASGHDIYDLGGGAGNIAGQGLLSKGKNAKGGVFDKAGNLMDDWSGKTASDAALNAAELQAQSAREATDLQRDMYNQSREDMLPWQQAGARSLTDIEQGLNSGAYDPGEFTFDYEQYEDPGQFDLQTLQDDPGYQFRLQQGQQALERSQAARGGQMGGRAMKEAMRYNQGFASDEADRAYGRFSTDRAFGRSAYDADRGFGYNQAGDEYKSKVGRLGDMYNKKASLANIGQTQSGALGSMSQGFGQQAGSNYMQGANALAAGQVGAANSRQQGSQNMGAAVGWAGGKIGDWIFGD